MCVLEIQTLVPILTQQILYTLKLPGALMESHRSPEEPDEDPLNEVRRLSLPSWETVPALDPSLLTDLASI